MSGLIGKADGARPEAAAGVERAQKAWQESMLRQAAALREQVRAVNPARLAARCGASFNGSALSLAYWDRSVHIQWPDLEPIDASTRVPLSVFDAAMLLYYLRTADGTPLADRWIGFRDLPAGGFYDRAFQGYSGDRLSRAFGESPQALEPAAERHGGRRLDGLPEHGFAFLPLPAIRLAAVVWPGDEEFPARGAVLFDAAASHYLPTDGLALLGSGLVGRLVQAAPASRA